MNNPKFEKVHLVNESKHCKVFKIVKRKEKYIITLNMFNVSEKEFESVEDAENYIAEKPWELIFNALLAVEEVNKMKNENNTDTN